MDVDRFLADPRSRRAFLRQAGVVTVGSSAVFLAACGKKKSSKPNEEAAKRDAEILNGALDLEHTAIAVYTAGAPLLKGDVLKLGRQFLSQEKEHADALETAIRDAGGRPNRPKPSYDFPSVTDQAGTLKLATMIENVAIAAYLDAIPRLASGDLRATAASIVTSEAEHLSVLLGAQGRPQVPNAFVGAGPTFVPLVGRK
jgi:rubrerythrin